jgi:hypothetical protein
MSASMQTGEDKDPPRRKRTVPLWLVLLIAAALGVGCALLFPMTR